MANQAVVGILRTLLTADTAQFESGFKKATQTQAAFGAAVTKTGVQLQAMTPQAERMVKAFQGDKLLYQANNLVAAVTKVGGAAKLTVAEQTRVNRVLTDAIAKYAALGQQAPAAMVTLAAATAKVVPPTEHMARTLTSTTTASGGMSRAMAGLITIFGRYLGAAAIGGAILKTLQYAESLERASTALGTTSTATQRLENVAAGANTTLEALTAAITMMQDRLAGGDQSAVKALQELGLTVDQVFALNPEQQFILIAKALGEISSKEKQIQLGKDIFGRGFIEIIGTVRGEVDKLADSVAVLGPDQVAQLNAAEQAWDRMFLAAKRYIGLIIINTRNLANPFGTHPAAVGPFAPVVAPELPRAPALRTVPGALPAGPTVGEIKEIDKATADLQQRFERLAALGNQVFGRDIIARAQDLAAVIGPIANVTKLSEDAQADVNRVVTEALEVYARLGKEAPAHLKALEEATRSVGDATKEHRAFLNFIGEREIQDEERRLAEREANERAHRQFQNQLGEQEIRDHETNLNEQAEAEKKYRQFQNQIGEQFIQDEEERQKRRREQIETFIGSFRRIEDAAFGQLGTLFVGQFAHDPMGELKSAAQEAELEYLRLKRSAKSTAKEIQTAFERFREAEDRANFTFGERFKSLWAGIKTTILNVLNDILAYFTKQFLTGLVKGMAGARLGQTFGNLLAGATGGMGGGGIGGTVANVAGSAIPGGVLTGATATGLTAGSAAGGTLASYGASSSVLAAGTGVGAGAGTGTAAAAGGGAGGGAGFLANPAFWTNPWTIGVIGGIALTYAIWKKGLFRGGEEALKVNPRRDKFFSQFGDPSNKGVGGAGHNLAMTFTRLTGMPSGGPLFRNLQIADTVKEWEAAQSAAIAGLTKGGIKGIKSFAMGGFVPPNVNQFAVLHGGQFGEDITPRLGPGVAGGTVVNNYSYRTVNNHIAGVLDRGSVKDVMRDHVYPELNREMLLDQHGFRSSVKKVGIP